MLVPWEQSLSQSSSADGGEKAASAADTEAGTTTSEDDLLAYNALTQNSDTDSAKSNRWVASGATTSSLQNKFWVGVGSEVEVLVEGKLTHLDPKTILIWSPRSLLLMLSKNKNFITKLAEIGTFFERTLGEKRVPLPLWWRRICSGEKLSECQYRSESGTWQAYLMTLGSEYLYTVFTFHTRGDGMF